MKHTKKIVALALVLVTVLAIGAPALAALSGSYVPYLGGSGTTYNIKSGQTGDKVKNVQMLMNACLGTSLTLDGNFGPNTEKAVMQFQSKYGLAADGIVGAKTKQMIWDKCNVWPNLITVY